MSAIELAYVGDAVYELFIRSFFVARFGDKIEDMHNRSVRLVKAETQAEMLKVILDADILEKEERQIVRRGRNAKSGQVPKSTSVFDYRYSTAFESLIGFLYLDGRYKRLNDIFSLLEDRILKLGEDSNEGGAN